MKNSNWWLNSELQSLRAKSNICAGLIWSYQDVFCNLMVSTLISLIHFETVRLFDLCPKSTPGVKTVSAVLTECTKLHISVYSLEKQSGTNNLEAISEKTFILTAALLWVSKKEKSLSPFLWYSADASCSYCTAFGWRQHLDFQIVLLCLKEELPSISTKNMFHTNSLDFTLQLGQWVYDS